MPKLTGITLKGFKSYVDKTHIPLADGLNVLTGPSDAGKSTVLAAVYWVHFGEPQGEGFLFTRWGPEDSEGNRTILEQADEAEVTTHWDNGVDVRKLRRKGKTQYFLTGYEEPFNMADVPQEVKDAVGLTEYSFGDFEANLNFFFQMAPPFLISEAASAGAKVLGKLSGTEVVDLAIGDVRKKTSKAQDERRHAEKTIEGIAAQILDYADLDDLKVTLQGVNNLINVIHDVIHKRKNIASTLATLGQIQTAITTYKATVERLRNIEQLNKDLTAVEDMQKRILKLATLIADIEALENRISGLTGEVQQYQHLGQAEEHIKKADASSARHTKIYSITTEYQKLVNVASAARGTLDRTKNLGQAQDSLQKAQDADQRKTKVNTLVQGLAATQGEIYRLKLQIDKLTRLEEAQALIEKAEAIQAKGKVMADKLRAYRGAKLDLDDASSQVEHANSKLVEAQQEYEAAKAELGGICPTCEKPF